MNSICCIQLMISEIQGLDIISFNPFPSVFRTNYSTAPLFPLTDSHGAAPCHNHSSACSDIRSSCMASFRDLVTHFRPLDLTRKF